MKKIISILIISIIYSLTSNTAFAACFPEGCFNTSNGGVNNQTFNETYTWLTSTVPQSLLGSTPDSFTGNISYTHPVWHHGTSATFVNGQLTALTCYNGFSATFTHASRCSNGTINYPTCSCAEGSTSCCASGQVFVGGQCRPICPNQAINPPACDQCAADRGFCDGSCKQETEINAAASCTSCPAGMSLVNGHCTRLCTNGASNPPTCSCAEGSTSCCPAGQTFAGGQCRNSCSNGAINPPECSQCGANSSFMDGTCTQNCGSTNVCGQTITGHMVNGTCRIPENSNSSCIVNFKTSTPNVNPNGSVEFTWELTKVPGIGSRCGFVDLTTATPRPIPGLQNLDPNLDRVRISNVQTTTRFCLVCQFYKLLDNSVLGDAAVHQWVRVLRIGEQ